MAKPDGRTEPPRAGPADDWAAYFEEDRSFWRIFRAEAADYLQRLEAALPLDRRARVLDFGCGAGLVAAVLAPKVAELFLWDAAASMRRRARENLAGSPNVRFLDLSPRHSLPGELGFDLILVNSVAQYMAEDDLSSWLVQWRDMLAPGGRLVVSDLIPPRTRTLSEVAEIVKFSARHGLLVRALRRAPLEMARYARVRRAHPLYRTTPEEFRGRARAAGWAVEFLKRNLTYRRRRFTAVLTHPSPGAR